MTVRSALRAPVRAAVRAPIILRKRWTPAALFADGQQGIWLEASPTYKGEQVLWQQSDGTVIVDAHGDPVGRADDLSPNGNNATQSVSADRPLYQTDGSLHWLEHDAAGDYLSSPAFSAGPELWLFFAGRHGGSGSYIFSMSENSGSSSQYLRLDAERVLARPSDVAGDYTEIPVSGTATNAVYSIRVRQSDRTLAVWKNGALVGQSVMSGTDWFPFPFNLNSCGLRNGANGSDTIAYGYILVNDVVSDSSRVSAENYLAKRAGITL